MRRRDIQQSVEYLREVIEETQIFKTIDSIMRSPKGPDKLLLLNVFQKFSIAYDQLSQTEKQILKIFNLDILVNIEKWTTIISHAEDRRPADLSEMHYNLRQFTSFLPKILELFKQDYIDIFSKDETIRPGEFSNKDILTIILPEEDEHFSKPLRLSEIINGVIQLYQACAFACNESADDIVVLAIDSGSDKSFDFLGNAAVIKCLKETIFDIWDRIVFHKERVVAERIKVVSETLPLLEKINHSEQVGNIGREQAEILRRSLIGGAEKFVATGATTPELDSKAYNNPRQLMAPERKMLVEKTTSTEIEDQTKPSPQKATIDDSELSPDDIAMFRAFIKMKKGESSNEHGADEGTENNSI